MTQEKDGELESLTIERDSLKAELENLRKEQHMNATEELNFEIAKAEELRTQLTGAQQQV